MEDETAPTSVEDVLAALSDPTRRHLLDRMSVHGQTTATALAGELSISRQAVVQHLGTLASAGLVSGKRLGRERRYEVRSGRLTETARWMEALAVRWDSRLETIEPVVEQPTHPVTRTSDPPLP